jgi:GNAT superfamily N-acetyltransferase
MKILKNITAAFRAKAPNSLRLTALGGHSIHAVDPNSQKSLRLLEKAYKEVYETAFPIDEERESMDVWLRNLKGQNPSVNIVVLIAGDKLDTKHPVIKAISVAYYYNKYDSGLLAYNAVAPEFQGQGLGRTMVEARQIALLDVAKSKGRKLGGVFIECNDPAKIKPEDDVMDPATRIKMFERWGARVLPIDYVQPPLGAGRKKCASMKLLAYPHPVTGKYPTNSEIKDFVNGIYGELEKYLTKHSNLSIKDFHYYKKTMEQIDNMKPLRNRPSSKPSPRRLP